jgi:hypothetical protein
MKKPQRRVKPPLAKQITKMFPRNNATYFIILCLFISFQWGAPDLSFWLGSFSKNRWVYQFVSLVIASTISGVQNN